MSKFEPLDLITDSDKLIGFWAETNRHPVLVARAIFDKRFPGYVTATRDLGHYAANRAAMLSCEQREQSDAAHVYREICACIYDRLPWQAACLVKE